MEQVEIMAGQDDVSASKKKIKFTKPSPDKVEQTTLEFMQINLARMNSDITSKTAERDAYMDRIDMAKEELGIE